MPFKDSLSKFAKTVGEGAAAVAKKSGDVVEVTKLNMSIQADEDKIKNLYCNIGSIIYKKYENGEPLDQEIVGICEKIKSAEENISDLKQKVSEIKNLKICKTCKSELANDIIFCPKCGAKQE